MRLISASHNIAPRAGKILLAVLLMILITSRHFPLTVSATTDGIRADNFTIYVDGQTFEPWGYSSDWAVLHLTLHDMAYMLSGTTSQFDIRTPPDERWDFWVIRGGEYTPTGNEMQPIPEERLCWGTSFLIGDFYTGWGYWPTHTLFIGVDGTDTPKTTIAVRVVQDEDNYFFRAHDLADLLGFELRFTNDLWGEIGEYVEGFDYMISTGHTPADLPVQTPETVRLLSRLFGHWVDREHFFAEEIDESVVWPAEFFIRHYGIGDVWISVAPRLEGWSRASWEWRLFWSYPVSLRELGSGLVEITIGDTPRPVWNAAVEYAQDEFLRGSPRFYNHRIIVDTGLAVINELTLYIGEDPHIMYRTEYQHTLEGISGRRHTATPAEGGGITLRYILDPWAFSGTADHEIVVHRSQIRGEPGEIIFRQQGITSDDRLLFEFTDPEAMPGHVYYYSMRSVPPDDDGHPRQITGWNIQLRVDTNEILGGAELSQAPEEETEVEVQATPEEETEPPETPDAEILQYELLANEEAEPAASENPETSPRSRLVFLLALPACFAIGLIVKTKANNTSEQS